MPRRTLLAVWLVALAALTLTSGAARAANIFEKGFWMEGPRYDSKLPPCERMLWDLSWNFAEKERTFWNSDLKIIHYTNVREIAYRPWQSGSIPRRYCTAQAHISDGKVRTVNFSVIEDGGIAGFRDGVEFCVIGLDRNWAFNPACRMARP
jgi:hypothetical protein